MLCRGTPYSRGRNRESGAFECIELQKIANRIFQIVPKSSATLSSFYVRSGSIQADHINMCKFSSSDDSGYKRVAQEIKALIKKALEEETAWEEKTDIEQGMAKTFPRLLSGAQSSRQGFEHIIPEVEEAQ